MEHSDIFGAIGTPLASPNPSAPFAVACTRLRTGAVLEPADISALTTIARDASNVTLQESERSLQDSLAEIAEHERVLEQQRQTRDRLSGIVGLDDDELVRLFAAWQRLRANAQTHLFIVQSELLRRAA